MNSGPGTKGQHGLVYDCTIGEQVKTSLRAEEVWYRILTLVHYYASFTALISLFYIQRYMAISPRQPSAKNFRLARAAITVLWMNKSLGFGWDDHAQGRTTLANLVAQILRTLWCFSQEGVFDLRGGR